MDPIVLFVLGSMFGRKQGAAAAAAPQPSPHPFAPPPHPSNAVNPPFVPPVPQPPFPNLIPVQPGRPAPGMLKAVEVWRVNTPMPVDEARSGFPHNWEPVPQSQVTPAETQHAIFLLGQWQDGKVQFEGPDPATGKMRAFRMTQHPPHVFAPPAPHQSPASPVGPAPAPSGGPPPFVPGIPPDVPHPAVPVPLPPAPDPGPPPAPPSPSTHKFTTVRSGEGLANVAKRLLGHGHDDAWPELRAMNIPQSADGKHRSKIEADKGGISPHLNPGDRLWVPDNWDVDDGLL